MIPTQSSYSKNYGDHSDDDNFSSTSDFKYSKVLDISIFQKIIITLLTYFSKVHTSRCVPSQIVILYYIFYCVQFVGPPLLQDNPNLWVQNELIPQIVRVISFVWSGPKAHYSRVTESLVLFIIYLLLFLLLFIRALTMNKSHHITKAEALFVQITYKYILGLLAPHLVAGIPICYHYFSVRNTKYQYINFYSAPFLICIIIFCTLMYSLYLVCLYIFFAPRVLLESTGQHEWIALSTAAINFFIVFLSFLTGMIGVFYEDDSRFLITRIFCIVLYEIIVGIAFYTFWTWLPYLKRIYSHLLSSLFLAQIVFGFYQLANLFVGPFPPEATLLVYLALCIAAFIALKFLLQRRILKVYRFYDNCLESPEVAKTDFDSTFSTRQQFISAIRLTFEDCHPFLLSFTIFDIACQKWPESTDLLILFGRILSLFPIRNDQMIWVCQNISHLKNSISYRSYVHQFHHISRTRQTNLSPFLKMKIEDIQQEIQTLKALMRRLWEGILQKSTLGFYENANKVHIYLSKISDSLRYLSEDYPNSAEVLQLYYDFLANLYHDYPAANAVLEKLNQLKRIGISQPDIAMSLAVRIFSSLSLYAQDFSPVDDREQTATATEFDLLQTDRDGSIERERLDLSEKSDRNNEKTDLTHGSNYDSEDSSKNKDEQEIKALAELIDNSPLGSVTIGIIFISLIIILSICLYVWVHTSIRKEFFNKQNSTVSALQSLSLINYDIARLIASINLQPLLLFGYSSNDFSHIVPNVLESSIDTEHFPDIEYDSSTKKYTWQISDDNVLEITNELSTLLEQLSASLSTLSASDLLYNFTTSTVYEERTFTETVLLVLVHVKEVQGTLDIFSGINKHSRILYNSYSEITSFLEYYSKAVTQYIIDAQYDSLKSLNEKNVLSILVILLLVSLPFLLNLFLLHNQTEAIAESFSYFPNTEIRKIINSLSNYNSQSISNAYSIHTKSSKTDEDVAYISQISQFSDSLARDSPLQITSFLISFVPFLIISLINYYMVPPLISNSIDWFEQVQTMYQPFCNFFFGYAWVLTYYARFHNLVQSVYEIFSTKYQTPLLEMISSYTSSSLYSDYGTILEIIDSNGTTYSQYNVTAYTFDYAPYFGHYEYKNPLSLFEILSMVYYPSSLDFTTILFYSLFTFCNDKISETLTEDYFFDYPVENLGYWLLKYIGPKRNVIYFQSVLDSIKVTWNFYRNIETILLVLGIIFQIIGFVLLIIHLISKRIKIKRYLHNYIYIKPGIITSNNNAMHLLETGKTYSQEVSSTYSNASEILNRLGQGIVITDRNLVVIDFNPSFCQLIHKKPEDIQGSRLSDLLKSTNNDCSWLNFIHHISSSLEGKNTTQFSEDITAALKFNDFQSPNEIENSKNNKDNDNNNHKNNLHKSNLYINMKNAESNAGAHSQLNTTRINEYATNEYANVDNIVNLHCSVICVTGTKIALETEYEDIRNVAIIFDDFTEDYLKNKMVEKEQSKSREILSHVIPRKILSQIEQGATTIALSAQSCSIVVATIIIIDKFNNNTQIHKTQQPNFISAKTSVVSPTDLINISGTEMSRLMLQRGKNMTLSSFVTFYRKLYEEFDKLLEDNDILTKVDTCGVKYTFIGGLFSQTKSDKHAEEAIRVSLQMIDIMQRVSEELDVPAEIKIGIHTGGPLIFGIMNQNKPALQIVGEPLDIASEMSETGVVGKVQISRAVYELIFSIGFHIIERGDSRLGDNVTTYLVLS